MSDTLRSHTIRLASSLPKGSPVRKALIAALSRKAVLSDGPIGKVLDRYWNVLHDLENDLEKAGRDYDDAASYMGGPAVKAAKDMLKELKKVTDAVEDISLGLFNGLAEGELSFMQDHGDPADYVVEQRNKMFPR